MKRVRAAYDNAILYNDFIVKCIIDLYLDKESTVLYVSDHGEEVFDTNRDITGHNGYKSNRFMVEVPMIFWLSSSVRRTQPVFDWEDSE